MRRFQYQSDRYADLKAELDKLDQPHLFATMNEEAAVHVTENLGGYATSAELWMCFLGSLFSIGVDFITAAQGAAAAREFVARSHNTLERLIDDPDFGREENP